MCQTDSAILQLHWTFPNGLFIYVQACIFSWFKLFFNVYAERTVHRQDFLAPNLTYPPPPGNQRELAQNTCRGMGDLTFESCPGARNSTRTGILWKMKVKLQKKKKKIAWSKFLQVKTKEQAEFLAFFEVYAFLNGIYPGLWVNFLVLLWVNFLVLLSHIPYKKSELPLACLYLKFSLGYDYPHLLLYKRLWLC